MDGVFISIHGSVFAACMVSGHGISPTKESKGSAYPGRTFELVLVYQEGETIWRGKSQGKILENSSYPKHLTKQSTILLNGDFQGSRGTAVWLGMPLSSNWFCIISIKTTKAIGSSSGSLIDCRKKGNFLTLVVPIMSVIFLFI